MSSLSDAAPLLCCPRCRSDVEVVDRALRCTDGHTFDVARQGYVNLLTRPAGAAADDATMVAARTEVLDSGVYEPIREAVIAVVSRLPLPEGAVVDVGAGTGWYTAGVLDALEDRTGVAVDLSAFAARRAARAHPRLASLVADAWEGIPVGTGRAALVMDVFAPRNAAEFGRILAPGGSVAVVTPAPEHLGELVTRLSMPRVDPRKSERLTEAFVDFAAGEVVPVRRRVEVPGRIAARLAAMGPAAHHVSPKQVEDLSEERTVEVTIAVDVSTFRSGPRGDRP